jgi:hypothetical protein
MNGRKLRYTGLLLAVIVVAAWSVTPALASTAAQGAVFPAIGAGNWNPISSSKPLEFVLDYSGNKEGADVQLASNPAGAVKFNVYTDSAWKSMGLGDYSQGAIGKGTDNPHEGDNINWTHQTPFAERFHVQVFNTTSQPASFWITQNGSGNSKLYAVSTLAAP